MKKLEIIAHRGARGPFMENTFEAFDRVIQLGVKAIEMDVRLDYRNGRFFLEHDFFHHPKYRQNLLSIVIPRLPKHILHVVELKTIAWRKVYVSKFKKVYDELFKNRRSVVISFNPFVLIRLRQIAPKIKRGALISSHLWLILFKLAFHHWINPHYVFLHKKHLKEKNIKWARKRNFKIIVYPINNYKWLEHAIIMDIDGIVTDFPLLAKKFVSKNKHRKYFI